MAKSDFDFPAVQPIVNNKGMGTMPWLQLFTRWQHLLNRKTWRSVTTDRVLGVVYVNGTGRPITIHVRAVSSVAGASLGITTDGAVFYSGAQVTLNTVVAYAEISNGSSYKVEFSSGVGTLHQWHELR